ncbi:malonyl-CoA-acyl carrier protein transacylase, mitochondrial [Protopterus annectens]|uniref:malonyl-CoA-acyl carrier protein transacylase, mitochondrial n=1 Tax=Protopterus annectens TaxID=7888 RepID=UPI001CFA9F67|nr:malonyl-CoA-acyl carrier protein transacylase, mitochondrial [Protopterus annectens]
MQRASDSVPSGMLSVIGQAKSDYRQACLEACEHSNSVGIQNPVCQVASYLFPDGRVIAGHMQALEYLQENSRKFYFRRTKILPVSGAFHTSLMEPATQDLADVLKKMNIEKPSVAVYSNVEAATYAHDKQIRKLLSKQLISPVKWEQTMHALFERRKGIEFPRTYEVGPGRQLGVMLKNCNLKAWQSYTPVAV